MRFEEIKEIHLLIYFTQCHVTWKRSAHSKWRLCLMECVTFSSFVRKPLCLYIARWIFSIITQ
ncbi:hypothetical protein Bpfe_012132, partial [Biomphalaria pfeifferi]